MAHHDFDLSDVLDQLRLDESGGPARQMVGSLYQAPIEAKATEVVRAGSRCSGSQMDTTIDLPPSL